MKKIKISNSLKAVALILSILITLISCSALFLFSLAEDSKWYKVATVIIGMVVLTLISYADNKWNITKK